jgi:hypothetical protein
VKHSQNPDHTYGVDDVDRREVAACDVCKTVFETGRNLAKSDIANGFSLSN